MTDFDAHVPSVDALPASPRDATAAAAIEKWGARRRLVGNLQQSYGNSPSRELKEIALSNPDPTLAQAARNVAKSRTKELHDSIVAGVAAFNPYLLKEARAAFLVLKATPLTDQFLRYSEHCRHFNSPQSDAEIAAQLGQYASNMNALLATDKFSPEELEELEELREPLEKLKRAVPNDPSWTRHVGALLTHLDKLAPPPGPPEDEPPPPPDDEVPPPPEDEVPPPLPQHAPPPLPGDEPPPLPRDAPPALRRFELPSPEFPPPPAGYSPPLHRTQRNLAPEFAAAGPGSRQAGVKRDLESLMEELHNSPGDFVQRVIDVANEHREKVVQSKADGRPGDAVSSTSAQELAKHLTTMLLDDRSPWSLMRDDELRNFKSALDTLDVHPTAVRTILDLVGWRKWEMKQELFKQVRDAHDAISLGESPLSRANELRPQLDRMVRRWKALDGGLPAGASTEQAFSTSLINEALQSANLQNGRDGDVQAVAALREAFGLV